MTVLDFFFDFFFPESGCGLTVSSCYVCHKFK